MVSGKAALKFQKDACGNETACLGISHAAPVNWQGLNARMFFDQSRKHSDHHFLQVPDSVSSYAGQEQEWSSTAGKGKTHKKMEQLILERGAQGGAAIAQFTHKAQSLDFMSVRITSSVYFRYCVIYIHLGYYP